MTRTKQLLSVLLCALLVCVIMPLTASAATYTGSCGENVTWTLDTSTGVLTISGTGAMKDYDPNAEDPAPWNDCAEQMQSVRIEKGVTHIGDYAFAYLFDSVTSAAIPDGVTSIGKAAFCCTELGCLSLPSSVKTIGNSAFCSCPFTSVTIPDGVTRIEESTFFDCCFLTSVSIPSSVTVIDDGAFEACTDLTSIRIPDSVTHIGSKAFTGCSLTAFSVSEENLNYTSDADGVLYNKDKTTLLQYPGGNTRTSFAVPESVAQIGVSAFTSAESLTSVTVPGSVTAIGDWAFYRCKNLKNVSLARGLKNIGAHAFDDCEKLTQIMIPDGAATIGDYAFCACGSLADITLPDSVTQLGSGAFNATGISVLTIPDGVTVLPYELFYACSNLTSVHIPQRVTSIDREAFARCEKLAYICSDSADCYAKTFSAQNGIEFRVCKGHDAQPVIAIRDFVSSRTVDYRTTITFTFVDGKDTGAAGRTYTVKEATKSFTVQAKYILDGQTLAESETETVHVKDGLIDRIIAFLRRLFRRLPVVEQAYLGAQFREQ